MLSVQAGTGCVSRIHGTTPFRGSEARHYDRMTGLACYGFRVRSTFPLRFARHADDSDLGDMHVDRGTEPLDDADEPLLAWAADEGFPGVRFTRTPDGSRVRFDVDGIGVFGVSPTTGEVRVPHEGSEVHEEQRAWGLPAALCMRARGDVPLHAAAVEVDGAAVVVAAPGHAGKTTLAALLAAAGHRVLSEDLTCLRVDGDRAWVVPGPAVLRLRPPTADRVTIPGARVVLTEGDRTHVALDERGRGTCRPVPVAALALLHAAPRPSISDLDVTQVLPALMSMSFRLPEEEGEAFRALARVASATRVCAIERPLQWEAADISVRLVEDVAHG